MCSVINLGDKSCIIIIRKDVYQRTGSDGSAVLELQLILISFFLFFFFVKYIYCFYNEKSNKDVFIFGMYLLFYCSL